MSFGAPLSSRTVGVGTAGSTTRDSGRDATGVSGRGAIIGICRGATGGSGRGTAACSCRGAIAGSAGISRENGASWPGIPLLA